MNSGPHFASHATIIAAVLISSLASLFDLPSSLSSRLDLYRHPTVGFDGQCV